MITLYFLFTLQEEFKRLYLQLEGLKEKNMRLGNRHTVAKIIAMQNAANSTEKLNNQTPAKPINKDHQVAADVKTDVPKDVIDPNKDARNNRNRERRASRSDKRLSDGIVMKPYSNNLVRNSIPEDKNILGDNLSNKSKSTNDTVSIHEKCLGDSPSSTVVENKISQTENNDETHSQSPVSTNCCGDNDSLDHCVRQRSIGCICNTDDDLECNESTKDDSCASLHSDKISLHRSEEIKLGQSVSTEGIELYGRVCRSLENLDDAASSLSRRCEEGSQEKSVRSAHSTPRHLGRYKEIKDPDRARAFIMFNLSDRATLSEEVTV